MQSYPELSWLMGKVCGQDDGFLGLSSLEFAGLLVMFNGVLFVPVWLTWRVANRLFNRNGFSNGVWRGWIYIVVGFGILQSAVLLSHPTIGNVICPYDHLFPHVAALVAIACLYLYHLAKGNTGRFSKFLTLIAIPLIIEIVGLRPGIMALKGNREYVLYAVENVASYAAKKVAGYAVERVALFLPWLNKPGTGTAATKNTGTGTAATNNTGTGTAAPNNTGTGTAATNNTETGTAAPNGTETRQLVLAPASLYCGKDQPVSWQFGNADRIDPGPWSVELCRDSSLDCEDPTIDIVAFGTASSKGTDASEETRALQRGINLASAVTRHLQNRCGGKVSVSSYVLNLGRHNGQQEQDNDSQRKVIALIGIGQKGDEAVVAALKTYVKGHQEFGDDRYTACELYKLNGENQQRLLQTPHDICSDRSKNVLTLQ